VGGTIEGDLYEMPSTMVEMVLREAGFQATFLGNSLPIASLARAVKETRPRLFWLSVSHIPDGFDLPAGFRVVVDACNDVGAALVVGGRALTSELRQQVTYSAFCDTMQHLESFARTLKRSSAPALSGSATAMGS
jgi:methanogenic corrinoid protein MtbC1